MANYTPTDWETGDTITAPLMNKIENELELLSNLDEALLEKPIDLTENVVSGYYISPSNFKWINNSTGGAVFCLIPVSQYLNCKLIIRSCATYDQTGAIGRVAFLTSNNYTIAEPAWVTNAATDFIGLSDANTDYTLDIPAGCAYIYILKAANNGSNTTPQLVKIKSYNFLQSTDTTLSIAGQPADAKATSDALDLKLNLTDIDNTLSISGKVADANVTGTDLYYTGLSEPYNITWTLRRNISNGETTSTPYTALSDFLLPSPIFIRTGADTDENNINLSMYIHEFDSTKTWKRRTLLNATNGKIMRIQNDCAYVRIVFGRASATEVEISQSDIDNYFGIKMLTSMQQIVSETQRLNKYVKPIYDDALNYLAIGSSTTEGTYSTIGNRNSVGQSTYGFPYWIARENNYALFNIGHGGGGWLNHGNRDNNNSLSLIDNILKAQAYSDSTTYTLGQCAIKDGDICRYAKPIGSNTPVWTPLNLGANAASAFANMNIITIQYGVNDFKAQWKNTDTAAQQWTLGSITERWKNSSQARTIELGNNTTGYTSDLDNKLTVIGAMSTVIENLARLAPSAQIIIMLPGNFKKLGTVDSATPTSDEIQIDTVTEGSVTTYYAYAKEANNYANGTHNWENKTLSDYRAAMQECAEYYGVRTIDTSMCAINRFNIDTLLGDGIHPTLAYYKQIGYTIAPYVR